MEIENALIDIENTPDLLQKSMKLAGLVTAVFADRGFELVVVGGAAIEFYTEGAYLSGDIDFCRTRPTPFPLRVEQEIMGSLQARGGPRSWKCAGLFLDMLGFLENEAKTPVRSLTTDCGTVSLIPPEILIVERLLVSVYPRQDDESRVVAKALMNACLSGTVPFSWEETLRLAALPQYDITRQLSELRREIEDEQG